jgi:hypothetical protein
MTLFPSRDRSSDSQYTNWSFEGGSIQLAFSGHQPINVALGSDVSEAVFVFFIRSDVMSVVLSRCIYIYQANDLVREYEGIIQYLCNAH